MMSMEAARGQQVITGRVFYTEGEEFIADTNRKIKVFLDGWFGSKTYLGKGKTNGDGEFRVEYPFSGNGAQSITLEAVEKRQPFANDGLLIRSDEVALVKQSIKIPANTPVFEVGQIERTDAEQPMDITKVNKPLATNSQDPEYILRLLRASIPEKIKGLWVSIRARFGLDAAGVMGIYNFLGTKYNLREATVENLIDDLLNSVSSIDFEVDEIENELYWVSDLSEYEFDRDDCLPEYCRVVLNKDNKSFRHIQIRFRGDDEESIINQESDPKELEWGIRQAMAVFGLQGEAKVHLALGHILPGTCSTPFFKYIKEDNPLRDLLGPFIGQTQFINFAGSKGIIFGNGSVLEVSQLTADGVAKMILEGMESRADYNTWAPPEQVDDKDIRGHDQKVFYDMLKRFFTKKIKKEWETISEKWGEVYHFSNAIAKRYDRIPTLTARDSNPGEGDQTRLINFVTYMAHLLSFHHWYAHSRQERLASGDVIFVQTNRGRSEDGGYAPYGGADPKALSQQVGIARTLLAFDADTLLEKPVNAYIEELGTIFRRKIRNNAFLTGDINKVHNGTQI